MGGGEELRGWKKGFTNVSPGGFAQGAAESGRDEEFGVASSMLFW